MQDKKLIEAFNLFVDVIDNYTEPFMQDDRYFATDGIAIISYPANIIDLGFPLKHKPNCIAVIPPHSKDIQISISTIESELKPIMEEDMNECAKCNYTGRFKGNDCNKCKGLGYTTEMVVFKEQRYQIDHTHLSYFQLRRMCNACKILGIETISKKAGNERTPNLFIGGEVWFIIMPMADRENNDAILIL